jgi:hypothetical protein
MRTQVLASTTAAATAAVFILTACSWSGGGSRSAGVARQPTFKEREAITAAMPAGIRRYPIGCVRLGMSVSSNGRYAEAGLDYLNARRPPCAKYVSNGNWFLKKETRWTIIFNGSDPPPCSLGVPRELPTAWPCLR